MTYISEEEKIIKELSAHYQLPVDEYGLYEGQEPAGVRAKILILTAGERTLTREEIAELMLFAQSHEHTGSSYLYLMDSYNELAREFNRNEIQIHG